MLALISAFVTLVLARNKKKWCVLNMELSGKYNKVFHRLIIPQMSTFYRTHSTTLMQQKNVNLV